MITFGILFFQCIQLLHAVRYPNLAFVMHTHSSKRTHGFSDMTSIVDFSVSTWLYDTQLIVVDGVDVRDEDSIITRNESSGRKLLDESENQYTKRELLRVVYNGNPGCSRCPNPTYNRIAVYYGSHRTTAGILMAYDTFHTDWIVVIDDDNYIDIRNTWESLKSLNSSVPLLLAGRIGPHTLHAGCYDESPRDKWFCCTNVNKPCYAHLDKIEPGKQAVFDISKDKTTMEIKKYCSDADYNQNECCRVAPWPQGIMYGFPYRVVKHNATYTPHYAHMYPYGGAGYVVSKGMIETMGRSAWEQCMYRIPCSGGDNRIMTCILNHGFSLTSFRLSVAHHLKQIEHFMGHASRTEGEDKTFFVEKVRAFRQNNNITFQNPKFNL